MVQIGKIAPYFRAKSVINGEIQEISLDDLSGKYSVIFFYPLDFTFVCPTELHAFAEAQELFDSKNANIIAISVDSVYSHLAWLSTPKSSGGIEGIKYRLVSDITKSISRSYGVLDEDAGIALRGLFILDKNNVVQHASINNLGLGRNILEAARLVDAIIHHENFGEVCPANWYVGKIAMLPNKDGLSKYFSK